MNSNDLDKVKQFIKDFENGTIINDDIEEFKNVEDEAIIEVDIVKKQNKRKFMTQSHRSKSKYAYDCSVTHKKRGNLKWKN